MLYILEDMLKAGKNRTYKDIAVFLRELIHSQYGEDLSNEESMKLTYYLVREKLMNNGRPHEFSYTDIKTGEQKRYKFHLIEIEPEGYDIKSKTVTLRLSEHGLNLLFKTLERKIIKDVLYVAREDELKKQIDSINEQLERG